MYAIASDIARNTSKSRLVDYAPKEIGEVPSTVGAVNEIISAGRISGTPPTRVETTYRPAHAASSIAIPNDSVREVFRKIEPCLRTCILQV